MAGIFDQLANSAGDDQRPEELPADESEQAAPPQPHEPSDDSGRTHGRIRETVQELLKYGLLEDSHKPNLYRLAVTHVAEIASVLEPLDLGVSIDEIRGLAFVTVRQDVRAEPDEWSHPLVRRQRLNLEQSLLIAILRQHFIVSEQESGIGTTVAQVAVDDLIPQLQVYLGDLGSDAKERNRVLTLLDQLKGHGLVSTPDAHDNIIIRPIIAHLANPENLQALLAWIQDQQRLESDPIDAAMEVEE
ncbi:DUF4194 domain-containing protein [Pseudomonas aeruginosa]|uniref:DUF4194 domain-containing protein n=1 Tax=Pseudomonas aeruginosa TaxID=287 RepID=UPI00053D7C17|nr:DUF4194 domain-containing protein [Pseudomonas aeruginosa]